MLRGLGFLVTKSGRRMKKIVLFSPSGYVGGFLKERIQLEKDIKLYEITRESDLAQYKENYDAMIYSAAVSQATVSKYVQDNVVTALAMVSFCREHGIKRIIYLSSDSIYGQVNVEMVTERAVMVEPDLYGVTKYLAEKIVAESGIPYYILRLPGVVGRVWRENFISSLFEKIAGNKNVELYNADRDFNNILDIDDLTEFIVRLCSYESRDGSNIFLLGNTEKMKLEIIAKYIKELYQSDSQINSVSSDSKRYFTLNVDKAVAYGYFSKSIKTIIGELYQLWKESRE